MSLACKPTVLISYSHADLRWFDRLEMQLRILMSEGVLKVWSDEVIRTGENWYESILGAIEEAAIAVLLISPHYLTSEFVQHKEIPRLLERKSEEGMTIIPVICGHCPWRKVSWLQGMKVRPRDGRPLSSFARYSQSEAELASIAEEIYNLSLSLAPI